VIVLINKVGLYFYFVQNIVLNLFSSPHLFNFNKHCSSTELVDDPIRLEEPCA